MRRGPDESTVTRARLALAGVAGPIAAGRDFVRQALTAWSWPSGAAAEGVARTAVDDVVLAVSELLTNAVVHGGGPVELVVALTGEVLRVEVADTGPEQPTPRDPHEPGVPGGHGLHIVEKIGDGWGVVPREDGKTVWLEIRSARFAGG